jgi:hypothetical protein
MIEIGKEVLKLLIGAIIITTVCVLPYFIFHWLGIEPLGNHSTQTAGCFLEGVMCLCITGATLCVAAITLSGMHALGGWVLKSAEKMIRG